MKGNVAGHRERGGLFDECEFKNRVRDEDSLGFDSVSRRDR